MADTVATQGTSLSCEDVIVRAIQFFSTEKWSVTTQSQRAVTLKGKPPIPIFHCILTAIGLVCCALPGIILYFLLIRKAMQVSNLVVIANPVESGSEVSITHPSNAKKLVRKFFDALPTNVSASNEPT